MKVNRQFDVNPFLFISLVYLLIFVSAPGISLPSAVHDDGLFMRWSNSILNGEWLGSWNVLTTAKGPLHSLLTAGAASFGINPFFYKRIFLLLAALVFVLTGLNKAPTFLKVLVLIALLFDPFQLSNWGLQNLREGTYIPLQLIYFGLGVWSLDNLQEKNINWVRLIAAVVATATALGLMLITREARIIAWLEMLIWFLLVCSLVTWRIRKRIWNFSVPLLLSLALSLSAIIGLAKIPMMIVASLNNSTYQYLISNSFEEGEFPIFYGKLISIGSKEEPFLPRVPVRESLLNTIIENSPKGGIVQQILRNLNPGWKIHGCSIYPETCGEYAGGWFVWALRDAIGTTLEIPSNEYSFQRVVKLANEELNFTCKQTTLILCNKAKVGYMPSVSRWGISSPTLKLAKETIKMASIVAIPSYYPFKNTLSKQSLIQTNLEKRLRISVINSNEFSRWNLIYPFLSKIGVLSKWLMISLCIVGVYPLLRRRRITLFFNLPEIWIFFSLSIQILVYAAVDLTSFPAIAYLPIASPLYICLLGRLSSQLFLSATKRISTTMPTN